MTDTINECEQSLNRNVQLHEEVLCKGHMSGAAMASLERDVEPHCKIKHSET